MKFSKLFFIPVSLAAQIVFAVNTQSFQDSQSTDFKAGKTENVVISNTGKMSLGSNMTKLLESRTDVSTVFDVRILPDGSLIAASGSEGLLLVYRNKKWETLYKADQPYIFSLEIGKDGKIYIGTGGTVGKVIAVSPDGKESKILFEEKTVQYVWSIKALTDGKLLAATGPTGKLFLINKSRDREGAGIRKEAGTAIFTCKQKNIQALAVGRDGAIYAGTDSEAIVYKIESRDGKYVSRALYDAKEEEISALAMDDHGILYAATASSGTVSDQAKSYLSKSAGTPETTKKTATTSSAPASKTSKTKKAPPPEKPPGGLPIKLPDMMALGAVPMSMPSGSIKGNAVYRIDTLGFVTEVFRDQVNIDSLIVEDGKLYLGTGPDGYVFSVNPATEEITLCAKTGAGYVNSVRLAADHGLILGTGTPAQVVKLGPQLAATGTFTSKVFDAAQIAQWGVADITLDESSSSAGKISLQTRSSVIANPEDPGWSEWSKPAEIKNPVYIASPSARFFQYKLTLQSAGKISPAVTKVQIAYMQQNRRPQVALVTVNTGQADKQAESSDGPDGPPDAPPMPMMPNKPSAPKLYRFTWKASDLNGDQLRYDLSLRRMGTPYWIRLEKDFVPTMMQWDPRTVPDGKYELKVAADDNLSNPKGMGLTEARISDLFIVDNTAPVVKNLTCKMVSPEKLLIQADLSDEMSDISGAWISINAEKDWQYIAPADELYDNKNEKIDTIIPITKSAKPIMLMIKVTDNMGNTGFGWQLIAD